MTPMIRIGRPHRVEVDGWCRLCADVAVGERSTTLWFAVPIERASWLTVGRSDPFVVALLPLALREGRDIVSEGAMSERLHYGLCDDLIPGLCPRHLPTIDAPLTSDPHPSEGAVATGFSGGVDSLHTILTHGPDCEYPLTHLCVFDSGVYEGPNFRRTFLRSGERAERFAAEQGLTCALGDTNLPEALPERFLDVYSFRNLACALSLQGLLSIYLLSSGHDAGHFEIDPHNAASYDLLTTYCVRTESLTTYSSGCEVARWQKLEALSEWEPSWRWLHPCVYGLAGERNCGHCKKCSRDMVTLHALGTLERYGEVFDLDAFRRYLPVRVGFVLANRGNHLFDETLALMERRGIAIPRAARAYETQFRRAMASLRDRAEVGHGTV